MIIKKTKSLREVYKKVNKSQSQIWRLISSLHKDKLICGPYTKLNINDEVLITAKGLLILGLAYEYKKYQLAIAGLEAVKKLVLKEHQKEITEIKCALDYESKLYN